MHEQHKETASHLPRAESDSLLQEDGPRQCLQALAHDVPNLAGRVAGKGYGMW